MWGERMIRKISLIIMFLLMAQSVFAFSLVSQSKVEFVTNNPRYDGEAFVVSGVHNSLGDVSDEIVWEIDDFDQVLDSGYTMQATGDIVTSFETKGWVYPLRVTNYDIGIRLLFDSDWFLTESKAETECISLGGQDVVLGDSPFQWSCVQYYREGVFVKLEGGVYKWETQYNLQIDGQGSDSITLSDETFSAGLDIGSKNWFTAVWQGNLVSNRADPQINGDIALYYSIRTGQWRVIRSSVDLNALDGNSALDDYMSCIDAPTVSYFLGNWDNTCIDRWNIKRTETLNSYYTTQNYLNLNDAQYQNDANVGSGIGSIVFDDGNIYRYPFVTLTIDADRLQVRRSFGVGEIVSVDYPANMEVGQEYPITITTRNVGESDMQADLNLQCSSYLISGITTRYSLSAGQTKTDSGTIIFTGSVAGCNENIPCQLSIKNTQVVETDDTYSFTPKVCEASECQTEGAQDCFGNIINECVLINGVLKYRTLKTCSNQCVDEGYYATCDDNERAVCGDGICEATERSGERDYCPSDCQEVEPICGDGVCDTREKMGQFYQ